MRLNLKTLRKSAKLTIDQFAAKSGLSRGFISQMETGRRWPSAATLDLMAATLNVKVSDLVSDDDGATVRVQTAMSRMAPDDRERLAAMAEALVAANPRGS